MSPAHFEWLSTGSTESPMILTFLRSNSGLIFAMYPSSVVQTGVKSFGCENRTAHESPIQSWNRILPSVVSASKSGAVSPICSAIPCPPPTFEDVCRKPSDRGRGVEMALVGATLDDLGDLGGRKAELFVRVEEVRTEADACVRPKVADDLARPELAVDGLRLGSPDD